MVRMTLWYALSAILAPAVAFGQCSLVEEAVVEGSSDFSQMGSSVAVYGDLAAFGAPRDDLYAANAGSVQLSQRDSDGNWIVGPILGASDPGAGDQFGICVDLHGTRLAVGAHHDDQAGANAGAVYLFEWDGSNWTETQKIFPPFPSVDGFFGAAVALDADRLIVGAWNDDALGDSAGAAVIFHDDGSSFVFEQQLHASDAGASQQFGNEVAIHGDRAVVTSKFVDSSVGNKAGGAYVFEWDGAAWTETQFLPGPQAGAWAGDSVALHGDLIAVGAAREGFLQVWTLVPPSGPWVEELRLRDGGDFGTSVATNGDLVLVGDPSESGIGQAVLLDRRQNWTKRSDLSGGIGHPSFGAAVDLFGARAVIGAPFSSDLGSESGIAHVYTASCDDCRLLYEDERVFDPAGPPSLFGSSLDRWGSEMVVGADEASQGVGRAWVFTDDGTQWQSPVALAPSDGSVGDHFGSTVVFASADRILVGAYLHDSAHGAVYVFERQGGQWVEVDKLQSGYLNVLHLGGRLAGEGDVFASPGSSNSPYVHVFRNTGGVWTEQRIAPNLGFQVGVHALDLAGNWLFAGIHSEESVDRGLQRQIVAFEWDGTQWQQRQQFSGSQSEGAYGFSDALVAQGNRLLAGAPDELTEGVDAGAVYMFEEFAGVWTETERLHPQALVPDDRFGAELALDGDALVVGAPRSSNLGAFAEGSASLFELVAGQWQERRRLEPRPTVGPTSHSPRSLHLQGHQVLLGCPELEDGCFLAYRIPPLELEVNPSWALEGDSVRFTICDGQPGGFFFLAVVDVNGVPFFYRILRGRLDGNGEHQLDAEVPPGISGITLGFLAFGFDLQGRIAASERRTLRVD